MAYDKSVKVSQLTVDSMKKLGMKAAIDKANSGSADSEYVEAAKRFYGNRITDKAKAPVKSAVVGDDSHYTGQVPKGSPAVIEVPAKTNAVSNNYKPGRKMA